MCFGRSEDINDSSAYRYSPVIERHFEEANTPDYDDMMRNNPLPSLDILHMIIS